MSCGRPAEDKDVFLYLDLSGFTPVNPSDPLSGLVIIFFFSDTLTVVAFEEILSGFDSVNVTASVSVDTGAMTGAVAPTDTCIDEQHRM